MDTIEIKISPVSTFMPTEMIDIHYNGESILLNTFEAEQLYKELQKIVLAWQETNKMQ